MKRVPPDVITYCPAKWTTEPSLGPCYEVTGVMDATGYFYAETPFDFIRTKDAVKLNRTMNAEGGEGGSSAGLVIGAKAETRSAAILADGAPVRGLDPIPVALVEGPADEE
mgnify:CR=1 FL=1